MRLAIADPPYPPMFSERYDTADGTPRLTSRSRARRWYGDQGTGSGAAAADHHPEAGEWDSPARHRQLLEELHATYDGWAIATTLDGLEHYRPLPVACKVMIWHKLRPMPTGHRIATRCEAVIVYTPRTRRAPGELGQVTDILTAAAPSAGFAGAKPSAWTRWVLDAMGYDQHADTVDDLFPGSGAVTRATAQAVLL